MINKVKIKLIITNLFFIFIFDSILNASSNFYIVTKVDNEIITNIDIVQESKYLISLNNDLKTLDKKSLLSLAQRSLIREKIKKNELNKFATSLSIKSDILEKLIENFYKKLKLNR